jgi:hypothetical protein
MKDNIPKQKINQAQMHHGEDQVRRVASRMEGGAKNHGNRPVQKPKKG